MKCELCGNIVKDAKDIWKNDELKIQKVIERGYKVLVVWEKDYRNDKEKVIEECIKFLKDD
jgi:G:T-mismatch repair DNA endonuclease (very short patch repair protein)